MSLRLHLNTFPLLFLAHNIGGVVGYVNSEFIGPFVVSHNLCHGSGATTCGAVLLFTICIRICGTKEVVWIPLIPHYIAEKDVAYCINIGAFGSTCLQLIH